MRILVNIKTLTLFLFLVSCSNDTYRVDNDTILISGSESLKGSSTAGNLIATAIKETNGLDVVLYPSSFLKENSMGILKTKMSPFEIEQILDIYPQGRDDKIHLGRMSGKSIKDFIKSRAHNENAADLQTAGVKYDINVVGGILQYSYVSGDQGVDLVDEEYYKVGISDSQYDYKQTFPGYFYGNNLSRGFNSVGKFVSARESLKEYLATQPFFPFLSFPRAKFVETIKGNIGFKKIYDIQGNRHFSGYLGNIASTSGIITAIGTIDRGPQNVDIYIQDKDGDGNIYTSDAILIRVQDTASFKLGDEISVTGTVTEQVTTTGLSRTMIRDVSAINTIKSGQPLPEAVLLGKNGRTIPDTTVSTWRGDLNLKPFLNLEDGIDFWESLEGMRVKIFNTKVLGFRGGLEEEFDPNGYNSKKINEKYLNLYVVADGNEKKVGASLIGGLLTDPFKGDFNPEIVQIQANHLSKGIPKDKYYHVGDIIEGSLEGVLTYELNIFGQGEWAIVLPEVQKSISTDFKGRGPIALEQRPITNLVSHKESQLTIATFNVENLPGNDKGRIEELTRVVEVSLKCPDIVNLVEIQDNNGADFSGGSSASTTLSNFIHYIDCGDAEYKSLNIDPYNHNEGGEPGGNIRVAMIYNSKRVKFNYIPSSGALTHTTVDRNGDLTHNPGRIYPNAKEFSGTRKSIIAQFEFRGEKVFVIGNHFNSKIGDTSPWSNIQPVSFGSEDRRGGLARKVNQFVRLIEKVNPEANIAVVGDFNAYIVEAPMRILAGDELSNLMTYNKLIPENQRYTTNFNGSSQALDYIFANRNLLNKNPEHEILNINSDFMGRLSDHDPLISRFEF